MNPETEKDERREDPRPEAEELDLDWIPLDNGWQLVICDEEAWAEMGLTPAGFGRIIDRLQAVTASQPDGCTSLTHLKSRNL